MHNSRIRRVVSVLAEWFECMQVVLASTDRWELTYDGVEVTKKVEMLLQFGANIGHRDFRMATPLHYAALSQNPEAVSAILAGMSMREFDENPINMVNVEFHTPLHVILSLEEGHHTGVIVKMLLDAGADLNACTSGTGVYGSFTFNESEGLRSIFSVGTVSICVQTPTWGISLIGEMSSFAKLFDLPSCVGASTDSVGKTLLWGCTERVGTQVRFTPLDFVESRSVVGSKRTLGFSIGLTSRYDEEGKKIKDIHPRALISPNNPRADVLAKLSLSVPVWPNTDLKTPFNKYEIFANTKTTAAHIFFAKGLDSTQLLRDLIEPLYNPMVCGPKPYCIDLPWTAWDCYSRPWTALDCYSRPWTALDCYSRPWTALDCYSRPWTALDCYSRPWTALDCYSLPRGVLCTPDGLLQSEPEPSYRFSMRQGQRPSL
jgi:hypothetical protein